MGQGGVFFFLFLFLSPLEPWGGHITETREVVRPLPASKSVGVKEGGRTVFLPMPLLCACVCVTMDRVGSN